MAIPLNLIGSVYRETRLSLIDLQKLHQMLHVESHVKQSPSASTFQLKRGHVQLKNVDFSYISYSDIDLEDYEATATTSSVEEPTMIPVFENLSLDIPPGQTVAVVGASGSGKSSLMKLITRFYDVQKGEVLIDDQNVKDLDVLSFRKHICVVPQDVVLFNESLLFNLKYGSPEASFADVQSFLFLYKLLTSLSFLPLLLISSPSLSSSFFSISFFLLLLHLFLLLSSPSLSSSFFSISFFLLLLHLFLLLSSPSLSSYFFSISFFFFLLHLFLLTSSPSLSSSFFSISFFSNSSPSSSNLSSSLLASLVFDDETCVFKAAELAQLHDIISSFPEQYNTMVGERGIKLSGGEKQRVGVARCILRNPSILILDEATSALDLTTEKRLLQAMREVAKERTVIVISHRLTTLTEADKICLIANGRVEEEGTHQELLNQPESKYKELWSKVGFEES
ncbi:putative ABC transporter B family member 5 [Cardiosporidium cionae]|uniref:ABC transporter B family member 5 n=1 Tax=Cardiosporidium cionae TaxID=476202 RepID=A0ABQ7J4A1_9APIC|nr:putative ABC transporter B family member 5 [Cardiosporidium cionae]|eukprot:KAF8817908.1 putative ABC transporter B family member 5 [Cardiosporidium cionae]